MSPQDGLHEDLKKPWQALKPHCFPVLPVQWFSSCCSGHVWQGTGEAASGDSGEN